MKEAVPAAIGLTGVSAPIWLQWLSFSWSYGMMAVGGFVLLLTAHNKWMEARRLRREERDRE